MDRDGANRQRNQDCGKDDGWNAYAGADHPRPFLSKRSHCATDYDRTSFIDAARGGL
jgi:hypothetical protein